MGLGTTVSNPAKIPAVISKSNNGGRLQGSLRGGGGDSDVLSTTWTVSRVERDVQETWGVRGVGVERRAQGSAGGKNANV